MQNHAKIVIVGGGLAGLSLGDHLQRLGADYLILEARHRPGGRVESFHYGSDTYDLGPTWFWPGQKMLLDLVKRYSLTKVDQYAKGRFCYQMGDGSVQFYSGPNPMRGALRLEEGIGSLVRCLVDDLDQTRIHLNRRVQSVDVGTGLRVQLTDGTQITCEQLVLCVPPRLVERIKFNPTLRTKVSQGLFNTPTWMAGQAKFLAVYPTPFWRENGLSGSAFSQTGPLLEIHDASTGSGRGALFGFIGGPAADRKGQEALVRQAAIRQLIDLFGRDAGSPLAIGFKDWAFEKETTTQADVESSNSNHNRLALGESSLRPDPRIFLSSAEASSDYSGLLEGALMRSRDVASQLCPN